VTRACSIQRRTRRTDDCQPLPARRSSPPYGRISHEKAAGRPIWGGTWHRGCAGAEMLRRDLIASDVPYVVEGPDGPEYADFHSLRHTYLTMLGRHGVDLRTAQELAGHSTPLLTARYSHRRLYDLQGAVEKLPTLVPTSEPNSEPNTVKLRRTGTDDGLVAVHPPSFGYSDEPCRRQFGCSAGCSDLLHPGASFGIILLTISLLRRPDL
jgi:hypothetical protein